MKYVIDIPEDVIQRYRDGLIQLPNIYGMQEILDSIKPFDSFPEREKGTDEITVFDTLNHSIEKVKI